MSDSSKGPKKGAKKERAEESKEAAQEEGDVFLLSNQKVVDVSDPEGDAIFTDLPEEEPVLLLNRVKTPSSSELPASSSSSFEELESVPGEVSKTEPLGKLSGNSPPYPNNSPDTSTQESPMKNDLPVDPGTLLDLPPDDDLPWEAAASETSPADDIRLSSLSVEMSSSSSEKEREMSSDLPFLEDDAEYVQQNIEIDVEMLPTNATREEHAPTEDELLEGMLLEATRLCSRAGCFLYKGQLVLGLDGRGEGEISRRIKEILFPAEAPSVFRQVKESQEPYRGALPQSAMDRILVTCLGTETPEQIAVYPVIQKGQVVAAFYLDDGGGRLFPEEFSTLDQLMERAHSILLRWKPPDFRSLL